MAVVLPGPHDGRLVSRRMFEKNLTAKKEYQDFLIDVNKLLARDELWSFDNALHCVMTELVQYLEP